MTTDAIERIKNAEAAAAENEKKAKADAQAIAEKAKADAAALLEKARVEGAELIGQAVTDADEKARRNSKKSAERLEGMLANIEKAAKDRYADAVVKIREKISG